MFSKRDRPSRDGAPAGKRLRDGLCDLFASNVISGPRALELLDDAQESGVRECRGMASSSSASTKHRHAARDLRRRILKHSLWPSVYTAEVPTWDQKQDKLVATEMSFLLPHEVVHLMAALGDIEELTQVSGLDRASLELYTKIQQEMQEPLVGIAVWGDGVPMNWDRSESLECVTWHLPGLSGHNKLMRFPFTALAHSQVARNVTMDALLSIFVWSMKCLAEGRFPSRRHDGSAWTASDHRRALHGNHMLKIKGVLLHVSGDWKFLKDVLRLPGWADSGGLCFRCRCTPEQLREVDMSAAWRSQPMTHWDLVQKLHLDGKLLSPLFAAPWFDAQTCIKLDWLHVADLGVTADFLGSLFQLALDKHFVAGRVQQRCSLLWKQVQDWYVEVKAGDRLTSLVTTMIKKRGSPYPKLRASGAQARQLVPFGLKLATTMDPADPEVQAATACASHLDACYQCLSLEGEGPAHLQEHSIRFASQWVALERFFPERWHCKPKMHMFLELCSQKIEPTKTWLYRDEDFGGSLAKFAKRSGGKLSAKTTSANLLHRYMMKQEPPRMLVTGCKK